MAGKTTAGSPGAKGSMTTFWLVIGLAAVVLGVYLLAPHPSGGAGLASAENRAKAPAGAVQRYDRPGDTVSLQDLKGKVVVVHFWATWCPPCRAEFPEFTKYATAEAGEAAVAVLPVSVDQSAEPVGPFLSSAQARFPVYLDGGLANAFEVTAIPTTIVLDREGRVAFRREGAVDWSSKGVPALVARLGRE